MAIDWISRNEELPPPRKRGEPHVHVLVFSPDYPSGDSMRYRIVPIEFVSVMTEATHWSYIDPPSDSEKDSE